MGFKLGNALRGAGKIGVFGPLGMIAGNAAKNRGGGDPSSNVNKVGYEHWGALQQGLDSGAPPEDIYANILRNFKGSTEQLQDFLNTAMPMLGASEAKRLRGSDAMKHLQDQTNWDQGAMAAYGSGAGMMGRAAQQGLAAGQNRLAAAGLGRSSARAALQQQGMQNLGAQQADLWSRTFQQAQQNRWNSALGVMDANRALSQMALGQQITPRAPSPDSGASNAMAMGGAAANAIAAIGALL